jgi:hypothetical protein
VNLEGETRLPDVDVNVEGGNLPDVEMEGELRAPEIEIETPDVEIGTQETTVPVPEVTTTEEEITLPDIDIEMPNDQPDAQDGAAVNAEGEVK